MHNQIFNIVSKCRPLACFYNRLYCVGHFIWIFVILLHSEASFCWVPLCVISLAQIFPKESSSSSNQSVSISVWNFITENLPVFQTLQWLYHWWIRVNWWEALDPHVLGKERGHSGGASNRIKSSDIGVWARGGGGLSMVVFSHSEWSTVIYWDMVNR